MKALRLALPPLAPLPPMYPPQDTDYWVRVGSATAARWPALAPARVHLALGDGAGAALGSCPPPQPPSDRPSAPGNEPPVVVGITVGTSAAARCVLPLATALHRVPVGALGPTGLWCYRFSGTQVLVGGALTDGGSLLVWHHRTMQPCAGSGAGEGGVGKDGTGAGTGAPDGDVGKGDTGAGAGAGARAAHLPPSPLDHGLVVLPFWSGERATGWQANARGGWVDHGVCTTVWCGARVCACAWRVCTLLGIVVHVLGPPCTTPG